MARTELPNGVILPAEYSDDWYEDMTSNLTKLDDVIGSDSEKLNADGVDFLRMSSAALTDGGTGNFSDLNSSYKIKTGDLILDSGRKLYQVVSVDSTNETFTVGNSLFKVTAESDLAPVAESGDYGDLDNKPDLKPVATSGDYDDLTDLPTYGITRYCSSAITDNSSIAFSAISSTNKIKVGDFLLDTNVKLYQISSVDTANETVSVTTPLTQLALDSNVMHLSRDETVGGRKTFTWPIAITSYPCVRMYIDDDEWNVQPASAKQSEIRFTDKNSVLISCITFQHRTDINEPFRTCFRQQRMDGTSGYFSVNFNNLGEFYPENNNEIKLGTSTKRWKDCQTYLINGLTPSALSLPSDNLNSVIDISGFVTYLDGTANTYTAPANGWISITVIGTSIAIVSSSWSDSRLRPSSGNVRMLYPVLKNETLTISVVATTLAYARFIPCQGNI